MHKESMKRKMEIKFVREDSITKLETMDAKKREEIAARIISNHEVTEARAAHTIKKASK